MRVLAGALETENKSVEYRRKEKERASKTPTLSESRSTQTLQELNISLPPPFPSRYYRIPDFNVIFNVSLYNRTYHLST
jgi:hypothetical protein